MHLRNTEYRSVDYKEDEPSKACGLVEGIKKDSEPYSTTEFYPFGYWWY